MTTVSVVLPDPPSLIPQFKCLVATDVIGGIGRKGNMAWGRLQKDFANFYATTAFVGGKLPDPGKKCNAVIMGRKTWASLPYGKAPLNGRLNIVISRNKELPLPDGVVLAESLVAALQYCKELQDKGEIVGVFVIGGGEIYSEAFAMPECTHVYHTLLFKVWPGCDTFVDVYEYFTHDGKPPKVFSQGDFSYAIMTLERR